MQKTAKSYKSHWHCVFQLKYHLVLVTKYRKPCFTAEILKRLEQICHEQCKNWAIELIEFGGEEDHIHLLLDMRPNIMPSRFINSLKTVSSRLIRKEFSSHLEKYYWKPVLWTRAYCLITAGGAPIDILKQYIQKTRITKIINAIHLHPNALALWVENSAYIKEGLNFNSLNLMTLDLLSKFDNID